MIEWLSGIREVSVARVRLDGDWRAILQRPEIEARSASVQRLGMIHLPVVRKSDLRLITGRTRWAVIVKSGAKKAQVRMVECTDAEAIEIATAENIERRHLTPEERDREVLELVDSMAKDIATRPAAEEPPARGRGRPASLARQAIRELAEKTGVSEATLTKQHQRAEKRRAAAQAKTDSALGLPADTPESTAPDAPRSATGEVSLRTFGLDLDAAWLADVGVGQAMVDEAASHLKGAIRVIRELRSSKLPKRESALDRLLTTLEATLRDTRDVRPSSVCPWCKGQGTAHEACAACCGTCLQVAGQEKSVPAELRSDKELVYYDRGVRMVIPPPAPEPEEPELDMFSDYSPEPEASFADPDSWLDFGGPEE